MLKFFYSNRKTFAINLIIFILFLLLPPILLFGYRISRKVIIKSKGLSINKRAYSEQYLDKQLSKKIYEEQHSLEMEYISFIGWRPKTIDLKYITIQKPYNTRYSTGQRLSKSTWFFGGSSIWGYGLSDEGTIPSIYARKSNLPVYNFGEQAWSSRQSLNQLVNVIGDGYKPEVVIFYSGVNDVSVGCSAYNEIIPIPVHQYQHTLSRLLKEDGQIINSKKIIKILIEPYSRIGAKLFKKGSKNKKESRYNCPSNNAKSNTIASHLVNNWYSAYLISKANKAKFIAVLQPYNNYYGNYQKLPIPLNLEQIKSYEKVYPLIIKEINKKCLIDQSFCSSFVDGSKWINSNSNYFIDDCHLTEKGNEIIANWLIKTIK
tara:strand:+ start:893 stop:2017 length:1125 start_codon:yes stop_codon:yes gene_type:complete